MREAKDVHFGQIRSMHTHDFHLSKSELSIRVPAVVVAMDWGKGARQLRGGVDAVDATEDLSTLR